MEGHMKKLFFLSALVIINSKIIKFLAFTLFLFLILFNVNLLIEENGWSIKVVNELFALPEKDGSGNNGGGGSTVYYYRLDPTCLKQTKITYTFVPWPPYYEQVVEFIYGTMTRCIVGGNELCSPSSCH